MLIDAVSEKVLDEICIKKSRIGLAFSENEKYIYASGGNDNVKLCIKLNNKNSFKMVRLIWVTFIQNPKFHPPVCSWMLR